MYVAKYFPESSKTKMLDLVDNLKKAFSQHIDELDWMSDSTKTKAHEKLDNFTVKVGYPDKWKDYSTLDIDPEKSYYENLRAAGAWYTADNMSKLGKPTDKTEWGMSPQTVNAYYNPTTNEICFPAAILQPPFFNAEADDAVNYGGIGVVIGHEMSHGFDDQGRLFDKDGNMSDWWTAEDAEKFNAKAKVLVAQFDEVEIVPGVHANGKLSLGENIGDHGGLSIAYTAMRNAIAGKNIGLDRRLHPGSEVLPFLRCDLGAERYRRGEGAPYETRCPFSCREQSQRVSEELPDILRRFRHQGRRSDVASGKRKGSHLVKVSIGIGLEYSSAIIRKL